MHIESGCICTKRNVHVASQHPSLILQSQHGNDVTNSLETNAEHRVLPLVIYSYNHLPFKLSTLTHNALSASMANNDNSYCDEVIHMAHAKRLHLLARARAIVACSQPSSPTLGSFVEAAHAKSTAMMVALDEQPVSKIVLQQQTWRRLQAAFFSEGIDSSVQVKQPVLLPHERHANCNAACKALSHPEPNQTISTSIPPSIRSKRRSTSPTVSIVLNNMPGASLKTGSTTTHPLARGMTVRCFHRTLSVC
jgi:hypothetical protein